MLPGLDGTGLLLDKVAEALRQHGLLVHVMRYPTQTALDYEALFDWLTYEIQNWLVIYPTLDILGESFSGPLAMRLATTQPKVIRRLILVSTFVENPLPFLAPFASWLRWLPLQHLPPQWLGAWTWGSFQTPERHQTLETALKRLHPDVLQVRGQAILSLKPRYLQTTLLPGLQQPTLVLHGQKDRLVSWHQTTLWTKHLQQGVLHGLPGPHFLLQTQTEACVSLIDAFLT